MSSNKDAFSVSDLTAALNEENRADLVNALKSKIQSLSGQHVDILESLSPVVRKRVEVLREIQGQHDEIEAKFFEERAALEAKYQKLYQPLYTKRYEIVNGVTEVEGAANETKSDTEEDNEKGVPDFWLTAMKNNEVLVEEISERDEAALSFLKDIKWSRIENPKGFKLDFFCDSNPYFSNSVLTKTYHMIDEDDPILEKAIGFFNFFNPPQVPDDDDDIDEEVAEELQNQMEQDYDIGDSATLKSLFAGQNWVERENKILAGLNEKFPCNAGRCSYHGRVVEIYGPEASGKTTLALHVIAEAQKHGGYCAFVDAEHALDKTLAESIGVNTENLLLSQPDCGEQALSLVDTLIRSGSIDVVVVDSVAALVPKGELDGEMGDAHMAMQARLMSQALRKLSHSLSLSQTILIFINQVRSKLSTFGGFGGPTEVTCGGNALKFYASMRLNIKRIGFVKKGEEILGSQVLVKVVKNKLAPPFKTAQFELEFGKGICREAEIIELSLKYKLISKAGSMYYYNDQNFRGKDALKNFLADNHSILAELEMKLREKLLNADTKKVLDSDVIIRDVTEEVATLDSTDEETAAIVEA
ncbi:hypothetical protein TanjilG_26091 [Lupinus angustifolius]|uniref:RecA family profile 2 domain-containing protein n=1 Tax=Lupinus angustifolius TaxID=3871 RepID=A0A4P1R1U1_LUPAN|nr:hypothetical protein TanjilG_26091 [Lupinus angustifolius]